jgi:fumarate hydratase subunit beta
VPVEELDDGRRRISPPLTEADVRRLSAGDVAVVRGTVFAARDAAHRRMIEDLEAGRGLPFDPSGQILYYVGPTPERPGNPVGSAGPTTASRMDRWTPPLLERGLKAVIGKGGRGPEVREALVARVAVYLAALGGGGALAARRITGYRVIAYQDLGTEALGEIDLDDLPAWVVNDAGGRDFYTESVAPWRRDDELPEDLRL